MVRSAGRVVLDHNFFLLSLGQIGSVHVKMQFTLVRISEQSSQSLWFVRGSC